MTLSEKSHSKFCISPNSNIRDTFNQFKDVGITCLVVVEKAKFLGTITDGDIRKELLAGSNMRTPIKDMYQKNAFFILQDDAGDHNKIKKAFIKKRYNLIPIIDAKNNLIKVITWFDFFGKKEAIRKFQVPMVVMAGGKGSRMAPFTNILPKPLIPINNQPVIERIINAFHMHGKNDIYISINFKGAILKAYFQELNPKYRITFIEERKPLGTAGALSKLKGKIKDSFFLTNCDVLFDLDYSEILAHHLKSSSLVTLVASAKEITIPYGSLKTDQKGFLSDFHEKPILDYLINCGLYMIHPDALKYIPNNKYFDLTDLISVLLKKNLKVGVYPINDDQWIDVGQWEEYKNAVSKLK